MSEVSIYSTPVTLIAHIPNGLASEFGLLCCALSFTQLLLAPKLNRVYDYKRDESVASQS